MFRPARFSIDTQRKKALPTFCINIKGLSSEDTSGFIKSCISANVIRAKVVLWMLFGMEGVMTFLYIANTYFLHYGKFFPYYIYLYSFMLLFSIVYYSLFHIFRDSDRALLVLEETLILCMSIWSAVFSALDVSNGFSSYLFIQIMIVNSLIFRVKPAVHCLSNAAGYLIYAVMVQSLRLGLTHTFAELINPFFMLVAACVMIILNHHTKFKDYLNQKLIKEQNRKLEFYANHDFLTKIPNRKSIIEYLNQTLETDTGNLSCMMIDIDNFKLYNDTYGHIMGDTCLIQLSGAISRYVADTGGKIGRYGGEEFLIVFEDKRKRKIEQIAESLIQVVRDLQIPFGVNPVQPIVTISIGVHIPPPDEQDPYSVLTRADSALYFAKSQGKNRFILI